MRAHPTFRLCALCVSVVSLLSPAAKGAAVKEEDACVRVSPRDHRYLELSSGRPYVPVGINLRGAV